MDIWLDFGPMCPEFESRKSHDFLFTLFCPSNPSTCIGSFSAHVHVTLAIVKSADFEDECLWDKQ